MKTVRPARPEDVPTILSLIRELARYERLEHEVVGTEDDLRRFLFGVKRRDDGQDAEGGERRAEVLLAEDGGAVVGFALFFHNFSTFLCKPGLYLEDLFVLPEHRRHGWGKRLLRELARIAVARGCGRFEWAVLDWNEPAKAFYRSLGARQLDDWRIFRMTGDTLAAFADGG